MMSRRNQHNKKVDYDIKYLPNNYGGFKEVIEIIDSDDDLKPPSSSILTGTKRRQSQINNTSTTTSSTILNSNNKKRKTKELPVQSQSSSSTQISTSPSNYTPKPLPIPCDDKEGHLRIIVNLELAGRYRILKLLGQGTFGKVVEAYDRINRKNVAVKIIKSIQKYRDASKIELRVLNTLRENDRLNQNKCIHMVDWFDFKNHICIVSDLLSESVYDFLKSNKFTPFPPNHIQSFATQLLRSVAYLHNLKLVHTDLKPENILLVSNKHKMMMATERKPQRKLLIDTDIRLIDFGSATFENEYHSSVVSTRHYRAPEIILGLGWSYPCDVFSLGCILVEFYTGEALFQTHDNLEHLAMMEVVMGKMPDYYARLASRIKPEFFRGSRLDYPNQNTKKDSKKMVKNMKPLEYIIRKRDEASVNLIDLLKKMLDFDPNRRISVNDALNHPYFTSPTYDD